MLGRGADKTVGDAVVYLSACMIYRVNKSRVEEQPCSAWSAVDHLFEDYLLITKLGSVL